MRIAIVAPLVTAIKEPQLGGSQALLADIATGLTRRGHDVAVYASTGSAIADVQVIDVGVDPAELASTLFRAEGGPAEAGAAIDAFTRAYRCVSEDRWDVVHNHAFDAPAIALAPDDVPVVHTLHLPPRSDIAEAIADARERSRVAVAAVSRWGAASWESAVQVDVVLPNGVAVDRIPFSRGGGSRALYAGRLSPEKGAAEAIDIARRAGVEILVVGDAYDATYATGRIEPFRGADGVELRGAVGRDELWTLMGEAAVVLCPVLWDEPFGLVAAESQACGTPVVAFARGALGEVIRHGETGFLVEDSDDAVAILRDAIALDRAACRSHAERDLSLDRTLDAHEALYARLVGVRTS